MLYRTPVGDAASAATKYDEGNGRSMPAAARGPVPSCREYTMGYSNTHSVAECVGGHTAG